MAYSGNRRPVLPPVNTMGVRAYGDALDALFQEMHNDRLHVEELQRQDEMQQLRNVRSPSESIHFHPDEYVGMEHDWSQESENQPPSMEGGDISTSSRVLYYAMHVQHFGLSNEEIKAMERLMTVIYGTPPPISLATVVFPLVAAVNVIPSPIAATALLGYWLCLRMISKSLTLNVTIIEKAKAVAKHVREIWIITAPEIYTMKCHWFFDHAMEEEITSYGSLYQWSSAPFESHHRRLQIKVDQSTTNSANLVLEKYLLSKKIGHLFNEQCASGNPMLLALKANVDNNHNKRFPVEVRICNSMYLPKNSRVSLEELDAAHRTRISRSREEAYSRLVVRGKVYSSHLYWNRSKTTRQDLVHLQGTDNGEEIDSYGSIVLFLYNRRQNKASMHAHSSNQYTPTRARTPPRKKIFATPTRIPLELVSPQEVNRRLFVDEQPVVSSQEIPIQIEEEIPQGNIYERREFNFDTPAPQPVREPTSLFDCVSNGVLRLDTAANLILDKVKRDPMG